MTWKGDRFDLHVDEGLEESPPPRRRISPGKVAMTVRTYADLGATPTEDAAPARPILRKANDGISELAAWHEAFVAGRNHAANHAVTRAAGSAGSPLPDRLRSSMEHSLGVDLDGVRVHTGAESAAAAKAVQARAYTAGQDIHFASGSYDPESSDGQRLIAHEVAHTVQQRGSAAGVPQSKLELSAPGDAQEVAADRFADAFLAGERSEVSPVVPGAEARATVQRKERPGQSAPSAAPAASAGRPAAASRPDYCNAVPSMCGETGLPPGTQGSTGGSHGSPEDSDYGDLFPTTREPFGPPADQPGPMSLDHGQEVCEEPYPPPGQHGETCEEQPANARTERNQQPATLDDVVAVRVYQSLQLILYKGYWQPVGTPFDAALELLSVGYSGKQKNGRKGERTETVSASERRQALDQAVVMLQPVFDYYHYSGLDRQWADRIHQRASELEEPAQMDAARARVDGAIVTEGGAVVEMPSAKLSDSNAREYGSFLAPSIPKLISVFGLLGEQFVRMNHDELHELFKEMRKAPGTQLPGSESGSFNGPASVVRVQAMLAALHVMLEAPEAWEELRHKKTIFGKLASGTELVKLATEFVGSCATMSAFLGAKIAKLDHNFVVADQLSGWAGAIGLTIGKVVAAVEVIHDLLVLASADATLSDKIDAGASIGSNATWLGGQAAKRHFLNEAARATGEKALEYELKAEGAEIFGAAAGAAIMVAWAEFKWMLAINVEASSELVISGVQPKLIELQRAGAGFVNQIDRLRKASLLAQKEQDPAKRARLDEVGREVSRELSDSVDSLLHECGPSSSPQTIGAIPAIRKRFARVMGLKDNGAATPEEAVAKASAVLEVIKEILLDRENIVREQMGLSDKEPRQKQSEEE